MVVEHILKVLWYFWVILINGWIIHDIYDVIFYTETPDK